MNTAQLSDARSPAPTSSLKSGLPVDQSTLDLAQKTPKAAVHGITTIGTRDSWWTSGWALARSLLWARTVDSQNSAEVSIPENRPIYLVTTGSDSSLKLRGRRCSNCQRICRRKGHSLAHFPNLVFATSVARDICVMSARANVNFNIRCQSGRWKLVDLCIWVNW